jgi:hypothetical protein
MEREATAPKTQLKILESSVDRLVYIAQYLKEELVEISEKELIDISENVQYNKGCSWKMVQKKMDSHDPELVSRAQEVMQEVMELAQRSASKLRKLQRRFDYLQSGSGAGSITEVRPGNLRMTTRPPSSLCKASALDRRLQTAQGQLAWAQQQEEFPRLTLRWGWNCQGDPCLLVASMRNGTFLFQHGIQHRPS